VAAEVLGYW